MIRKLETSPFYPPQWDVTTHIPTDEDVGDKALLPAEVAGELELDFEEELADESSEEEGYFLPGK